MTYLSRAFFDAAQLRSERFTREHGPVSAAPRTPSPAAVERAQLQEETVHAARGRGELTYSDLLGADMMNVLASENDPELLVRNLVAMATTAAAWAEAESARVGRSLI